MSSHITNNLKQVDSSLDLLHLIKTNRAESLKLINVNKSNIDQIQKNVNIDQIQKNVNTEQFQFICSEKVFKVLKKIIY